MFYLTRFNTMYLLTKTNAMLVKSINKRNLHLFKTCNLLNDTTKLKFNQVREKSLLRIFTKNTLTKIKKKDNIPDAFQLIYRNTMSNYLLGAQIISTIGAGLVCFGLIISNDRQSVALKKGEWYKNENQVSGEIYIFLTVFLGICVLLQLVVSRMPLRVYNYPKQDEYIMIFYRALPTTTRRLVCSVGELSREQPSELIPWKESSYEIKNKGKVILIENFFRTPADLNIMLGYQKQPKNDKDTL